MNTTKKSGVYSKDIQICLNNLPKFAKDANYLRKLHMQYIRKVKKSNGIDGLGSLKPQVDSFAELSNTFLRVCQQMNKAGIPVQEPDIALELSNENT